MRYASGRIFFWSALFVLVGMHYLPLTRYYMVQMSGLLFYPFLYMQYRIIDPCKRFLCAMKERERDCLSYEALLQKYTALQAQADLFDCIEEIRDFKKHYDPKHARLVQVLQRTYCAYEHYFLLDKGSRHGVHDRMIVVWKNQLIGRVYELFPYHCKCILITDPRCKVAAYCTETGLHGVAQGAFHYIKLLHVSHLETEVAQKGDMLFSSGYGKLFPRGFLIGQIEHVKSDGLMLDIKVKPLISFEQITHCYLLERGVAQAS